MDINQAIETAKKRFTIAQWVIGIGDTAADPLTTPAKALDHLCTLLGVTAP